MIANIITKGILLLAYKKKNERCLCTLLQFEHNRISILSDLDLLVACSCTCIGVGMRAISHVSGHFDIVICKLAQLSIVRAKLFLLRSDAQRETRDEVQKEE